jgi:hypothetical protein
MNSSFIDVNIMKLKCRKGIYSTNAVVKRNPIVCYGFIQTGEPTCEHLNICRYEQGLKKWKGKRVK